ncbi:flavodoxin family protein [Nocardioides euryhalodurans]|uniref:flavodoxin family protein n=1 Tax=Nocardioides euryhalodurans TaxID=2518370 RepID=UPI001FC9CCE1|nr:NAD(P)H-dependent oxidoreductase [Nocardioides euryhalodurans]
MTDRYLRALVLAGTLKPSPAPSSTFTLGQQVLDALEEHGTAGEVVRGVDHHIRWGVSTDEGGGDAWPRIRQLVIDADILVLATPIWMGQPASVCKMVLERLDGEIAETSRPTQAPTGWARPCRAPTTTTSGRRPRGRTRPRVPPHSTPPTSHDYWPRGASRLRHRSERPTATRPPDLRR